MSHRRAPSTRPQVRCPIASCEAMVADIGIAGHVRMKHPDEYRTRYAGGGRLRDRTPRGIPDAHEGPDANPGSAGPTAPTSPTDRPTPEPELAGPAIEVDGLNELGREPGGAPASDQPQRPEVQTRGPSPEKLARMTEAAVQRLDSLASRAMGIDPDSRREIEDTADLMKPGAELFAPRMGAWFWLVTFGFALFTWWAGKAVARAEKQRARGLPATPPAPAPKPEAAAPPAPAPSRAAATTDEHDRVSDYAA